MQIPIRLIRRESRTGKSIQVITDEGEFLWIPRFALKEHYEPGERDIVLEVKTCSWSIEWSEEEWRRRMNT